MSKLAAFLRKNLGLKLEGANMTIINHTLGFSHWPASRAEKSARKLLGG
jgi:hypothetical protein